MSGHPNDAHWIGRRIAAVRRSRGWTQSALGERVGLSATQLSRIESGNRQSSVGTLIELARVFEMSLSELVAEDKAETFHLMRRGDRVPRESANGAMTTLSGNFPGIDAVLLDIPPSAVAPAARHAGEEWLYVLSGSIEVTMDDQRLILECGDALHVPSDAHHSLRGLGDSTSQALLVSTSARRPTPRLSPGP